MIYLDNAATSMPKPEAVVCAVTDALRRFSSSGRGSASTGAGADEILYDLRKTAGEMFSCDLSQVVLTTSATHGLNIAIKSLAEQGSRVVISGMEHNAVVRPLFKIGAEVHIARSRLFDKAGLLGEFDRLLIPGTRLCVISHVSNVFGWILPVEEVAELCYRRGIPLILDASQSAGVLPVAMGGCAFVAMPGHKGLLGPQGTGLLLCGREVKTLMEGGTGSLSKSLEMPKFLPDRLEAGTHNIPGAAGLLAGMRYVRRQTPEEIFRHEAYLGRLAIRRLREIPNIQVFSGQEQSGVVSFRCRDYDSVVLAEKLAERWNIALRAGLHCAPVAHETAGTMETGTIRVSPGPFSNERDVETLARCVRELMEENVKKP